MEKKSNAPQKPQVSLKDKRPKHLTPTSLRNGEPEPNYVTVDGVEYYDRNCSVVKEHDAHSWKTYYYNSPAFTDPDNGYCDGSGTPPKYSWSTSTYSIKPKKDYSEDPENFPVGKKGLTVAQARKIALDMHKDQKDKAGHPYGEHLNAVAMGVQVLGGSNEEIIAAYFHDSVEDYHTTYDLLRKIKVTEETIKMIEAVSKRTSEEQGKYLQRIVDAGPGAMRVKLADLMHNTRHDRIQALRDDKKDATADRLLKKYRPAMARLMLELGLIVDEETQKKFATKPQGSAGTYTTYGSSSTSGSNAKGDSWSIDSLFKGDWVSFWDAPIMIREESPKGEGYVRFILANGEVRDENKKNGTSERRVYTYSYSKWSSDASITFNGIDEDTVLEYAHLLKTKATEITDEEIEELQDKHGYLWDAGL